MQGFGINSQENELIKRFTGKIDDTRAECEICEEYIGFTKIRKRISLLKLCLAVLTIGASILFIGIRSKASEEQITIPTKSITHVTKKSDTWYEATLVISSVTGNIAFTCTKPVAEEALSIITGLITREK